MNRTEAIKYLTRCADDSGVHWYQGRPWPDVDTCPTCHGSDDAGHLGTPGSRYGWTSAHCAPVVYQCARIERSTGWTNLDWWMSLVVNDSDTPQEHIREYAIGLAGADVAAMVAGYLECQLWAQLDYDNPSCECHADDPQGAFHNFNLDERYGVDDVDPEYVDGLTDEFSALVTEHPLAVRMFLGERGLREQPSRQFDRNELFGHDFYLTREGHGAGFWDRGLGTLGDYLTDIAKHAGSADELSDNGSGVLIT